MENLNRRDLCALLTAFTAMAGLPASAQTTAAGEQPPRTPKMPPEAMAAPETPVGRVPVLSASHTFAWEQLPVVKNANGETRAVTRGTLVSGELVEMHETTLLPGHMPHPPHQHLHSEFMMVREGTIEFNNNGTMQTVGPGGVFFATSNVLHGLKNVGDANANYFVLAIGRDG
jgi:quercetin dioxygenase-like cupin family protein